jgi:hypothetical protein
VPEGAGHPALRRVLREVGDPALVDKLTELPGADLTTVLRGRRGSRRRAAVAERARLLHRAVLQGPRGVRRARARGRRRRFTDWTARLLGSRKERLLISGYGIDRIALASGA